MEFGKGRGLSVPKQTRPKRLLSAEVNDQSELRSYAVISWRQKADQACIPKNLKLLAYLGTDILVLRVKRLQL
jgi:hypothetical protein